MQSDSVSEEVADFVTMPIRRNLAVGVMSLVVAVLAVSSVIAVYYSPHYSWSSSIRDHDGDGTPDKSDPRPFDASVWGYCDAYINLTVRNNTTDTLIFSGSASSTTLIENETFDYVYTDPNGDMSRSFHLSWLGGPSRVEVLLHIFGLVSTDWKGWYWDGTVNVTDAQTLTVSLLIPDDFRLSQWYG